MLNDAVSVYPRLPNKQKYLLNWGKNYKRWKYIQENQVLQFFESWLEFSKRQSYKTKWIVQFLYLKESIFEWLKEIFTLGEKMSGKIPKTTFTQYIFSFGQICTMNKKLRIAMPNSKRVQLIKHQSNTQIDYSQ